MIQVAETIRFTDDILDAAKAKAREIVADAENQREKLLQEARTLINREAADMVRNAQAEAQGIKRRYVSETRHRVKLKEQQEKGRILSSVLAEAKERAKEMTKDSGRYLPYLARLINESVHQLGLSNVTIHLNADDLKRVDQKKLLEQIHKESSVEVTFANEPLPTIGGAVVSSSDGKIRINNTIEQRFEALEPKLLIEAGKLLFGNQ